MDLRSTGQSQAWLAGITVLVIGQRLLNGLRAGVQEVLPLASWAYGRPLGDYARALRTLL
jgi:hypothetical protein